MSPIALLAAVGLDFILGDPRWLPHPVRWVGTLIARGERRLYPKRRAPRSEFLSGLLLCCFVISVVAGAGLLFLVICRKISPVALIIGETIIAFYCLSARSLTNEASIVRKHLESGDLPGARKAVSMIVGRDTECLDDKSVIRATIETVAENITDGIVSPLFYLAIGGPVAALAFKAVSTMDSMIGYRNERYRHFGTCAARFDDVLNFVPARLTAFFLIPLVSLAMRFDWRNSLRITARDRLKHESPNSAHGEAAVAGALGVQLGGGAYYQGEYAPKPYLGSDRRAITVSDIDRTNRIAIGVFCLAAIIAVMIIQFIPMHQLIDMHAKIPEYSF